MAHKHQHSQTGCTDPEQDPAASIEMIEAKIPALSGAERGAGLGITSKLLKSLKRLQHLDYFKGGVEELRGLDVQDSRGGEEGQQRRPCP